MHAAYHKYGMEELIYPMLTRATKSFANAQQQVKALNQIHKYPPWKWKSGVTF